MEHGLDWSFSYTEFTPSTTPCTAVLSFCSVRGLEGSLGFVCLFIVVFFFFGSLLYSTLPVHTPHQCAWVWFFSQLYCVLYGLLSQASLMQCCFGLVWFWNGALSDFDLFGHPMYCLRSAAFSWSLQSFFSTAGSFLPLPTLRYSPNLENAVSHCSLTKGFFLSRISSSSFLLSIALH